MAENLQSLLERIHREGLEKAEASRDDIIAKAKAEAAKIVADAEAESSALRQAAKADADAEIQRAVNSIRQAGRDVVLALREEINSRMTRLVRSSAAAALTPEVTAEIVRAIAGACAADAGKAACEKLELMVAPAQLDSYGAAVAAALKADFAEEPEVFADRKVKGGVKVAVNGDDAFFDCTDAGLTELLAGYLGPKLAEILAGDAE
jgi:V/A-type H+-transporting ATPase subunit E